MLIALDKPTREVVGGDVDDAVVVLFVAFDDASEKISDFKISIVAVVVKVVEVAFGAGAVISVMISACVVFSVVAFVFFAGELSFSGVVFVFSIVVVCCSVVVVAVAGGSLYL